MANQQYAIERLQLVRDRIAQAEKAAQRPAGSVRLIGASKQQSSVQLQAFAQAGLQDFGENYLQEALDKQSSLGHLPLEWHFIGAIQSNKTAAIATHFNWVHSVDRTKIARRLDAQFVRKPEQAKLNILLQLNLDNEDTKSGVTAKQVMPLLEQIAAYPNIAVRGFMLIPAPRANPTEQEKVFAEARALLEQANSTIGLHLDTLSMGMSNDLEAAIAQGSTMVRIGTDLFGPRKA